MTKKKAIPSNPVELDSILSPVREDIAPELQELVDGIPRNNMRLEWLSPRKIAAHDMNWKTHPSLQREAYSEFLVEVGWAGALLFNENTGRLLDGHLRLQDALERNLDQLPVLVINVDEDTERKMLALLDKIGSMYDERQSQLALIGKVTDVRSQMLADLLAGGDLPHDEDNIDNLGGKGLPAGGISLVAGEKYNYVMLFFKTEIDFVTAQDHFGIETVKCAFTSGVGVGRVIDGSQYLRIVLPLLRTVGYNAGMLKK